MTEQDWSKAFIFNNDLDNSNNNNTSREEPEIDYYKILGVSESSNQKEIKQAYLKKSKQLHPDRHQTNKIKYKKLFQELCEAYSILKDENKRQIYNKFGIRGLKNNNFLNPMNEKDIDFLFKMAFDEDDIINNDNFVLIDKDLNVNKSKCKAIRIRRDIDRSFINSGEEMQISFKKTSVCTSCINGISKLCYKCDGKGDTKDWLPTMGTRWKEVEEECMQCDGKGKTLDFHNRTTKKVKCWECKGRGKIKNKSVTCTLSRNRSTCQKCQGTGKYCRWCCNYGHREIIGNISIDLKKITKQGQSIVFREMGHEKKNYINGDVIVTFYVLNDY